METVKKTDLEIAKIVESETDRQEFELNLIASENINGDSRLKPKNSTKTLSRGIPTTYW